MRVGDVIYVTHLDARCHVPPGGSGVTGASFKARRLGEPRRKGQTPVFAVLVLGLDTLENPQLDPDQVLAGLGWTPPPKRARP